VMDPVVLRRPVLRAGALVALVKADNTPGAGAVLLMKNVYLALPRQYHRPRHRDHPQRGALLSWGYVGGVRRAERRDRSRLWSVLDADVEVVLPQKTPTAWWRTSCRHAPHPASLSY